jgi:hypothetical protein
MAPMMKQDLQSRCEHGQELLMQTRYLEAEATLAEAERDAWTQRDYDTLARLYMPLQECRRQRRLRCGEGTVALNLLAEGPQDRVDGLRIVQNYPHGQLLVAGWGTIAPALQVRKLQQEHGLYVETFLAAVYPIADRRAVAIVPLEEVSLPEPNPAQSIDDLLTRLPAHSIVVHEDELPHDSQPGNAQTFAPISDLWERLHTPFLAAADAQPDPIQKIEAYRKTIRVDYACELAHQNLSDAAKTLARQRKEP